MPRSVSFIVVYYLLILSQCYMCTRQTGERGNHENATSAATGQSERSGKRNYLHGNEMRKHEMQIEGTGSLYAGCLGDESG